MTFDRIEPESETQRTEKALRTFIADARLPLSHGHVFVRLPPGVEVTPGGQWLVAMLVHQLARMKGIVQRISLQAEDAPRVLGVPLRNESLLHGLSSLVVGLSGTSSQYQCDFEIVRRPIAADVTMSIGEVSGQVSIAADGWRALSGRYVKQANWLENTPIGPYMAAVTSAADAFKLLLKRNYGWNAGRLAGDSAFSVFNFGVDDEARPGPPVSSVLLKNLAIAGAGAGGSAALYTLLSFPIVSGDVVVVEPGHLKASSLGRYLMTDHGQVHAQLHKLESVKEFARSLNSSVSIIGLPVHWHEAQRDWRIVISTVDTPEARRDVQRSHPSLILDGGVIGTIYGVLRVMAGGWCLGCKHPFDPEVTWKRRALHWGLTPADVKMRHRDRIPISEVDIERLSAVQGKPIETFDSLVGVPFDEAPTLTECGETPLLLDFPSQAPVLPMATTAAGIVIAAEVVKELNGLGSQLKNYITQDLRFRPKATGHRFKPRVRGCRSCETG